MVYLVDTIKKHGMVSTPKKTIKVKDTPKDKNVPKKD